MPLGVGPRRLDFIEHDIGRDVLFDLAEFRFDLRPYIQTLGDAGAPLPRSR
jgi:hypothetical protein